MPNSPLASVDIAQAAIIFEGLSVTTGCHIGSVVRPTPVTGRPYRAIVEIVNTALQLIPLRTGMIAAVLLAAQAAMASVTVHAERELHTVECVAALEVRSDELAKQVKAGHTELRPSLLATLDAGAAFIGSAYLQGDRDEARWQSRLRVALEAQRALAQADLAVRQSSCSEEGRRLLSEANFVGRAVVSRLVERRMQKVLGD